MQESVASPTPSKSGSSEIFGTLLFISGILLLLSLSSFQSQIASGQDPIPDRNIVGSLGHHFSEMLFLMFGKSSFLLGPYLILLGFLTIFRGSFSDPLSRFTAVFVMMLGSSVLSAVFYTEQGMPSQVVGGLIGARTGVMLKRLFGVYGSQVVAFGIFLGGFFLAIRMPVPLFFRHARSFLQDIVERYGKMFSGFQDLNSFNSPPPVPETLNPQETPFITKESDESRPWIEKMEKMDREENKIPPTSSKEYPETTKPPFSNLNKKKYNSVQISEHTRNLQAMLEEMRQRHRKGTSVTPTMNFGETRQTKETKEADCPEKENEIYPFTGRFDPDGSRFHFYHGYNDSFPIHAHHYAGRYEKSSPNYGSAEKSQINYESQSKGTYIKNSGVSELQANTLQGDRNHENDSNTMQKEQGIGKLQFDGTEVQFASSSPSPKEGVTEEASSSYVGNDMQTKDLSAIEQLKDTKAKWQRIGLPSSSTSTLTKEAEPENIASSVYQEKTQDIYNAMGDKAHSYENEISLNLDEQEDENIQRLPKTLVPCLLQDYTYYQLNTNCLRQVDIVPQVDITCELDATRDALVKVMGEYGIKAEVVNTQRGPIITLYEITLEPGIKISRVLQLQSEICMSLAVPIVRIIAPIPGKSTVGIEIPNRVREPVLLKQLLPIPKGELQIILGKNIAGENQYTEISQLPHLLIAGATGAGKSVYLNAVITSLLCHASPEVVRFVMIDPKMVELKLYEGIPHLLMPVITDVYEASKALGWLVNEMERRYKMLSVLRCRDIRSYNQRVDSKMERSDEKITNKMPYIVVFIDELSDLMMIAAKDVEDSIIRLTQKARAVGMHIIMATQRPSVDVITALIKANCPARVAFQVAQRTDSRTILDASGAENLLGKGDFLYKSPRTTTLTRIQSPFISDGEIEAIVKQARSLGEASYVDFSTDEEKRNSGEEEGINENIFNQACEIIMDSEKTSTSYLQRRMRIGYNRAANLIEMMEERGYLSPPIGNKPRKILKRA